ncbi:hypothetical protein [Akkermansia sp.]|uniref:hypothetical protein n=1 Tax=Akkermansia sp. TaxID=1872421 RepID=UPI0025BB1983|nr:hypothetical protein [Akkermansia sp.]
MKLEAMILSRGCVQRVRSKISDVKFSGLSSTPFENTSKSYDKNTGNPHMEAARGCGYGERANVRMVHEKWMFGNPQFCWRHSFRESLIGIIGMDLKKIKNILRCTNYLHMKIDFKSFLS